MTFKKKFEVPEEDLKKVGGGGDYTYISGEDDNKDRVIDIEVKTVPFVNCPNQTNEGD